jgi:MFS family permease
VQWVLNGYSLTLSVLIVVAGRLADMHGRRRLFFIGAGTFSVASLVGALAPGIAVLLAARVAMATGAAMLWPAVLGMTFQALPPARRALVIGVAGVGNAVGPLIGGALTQAASWRLLFALNIPLALLSIWLVRRYVHQPFERDPDARLDPGGVALLATGLVALLLALDLAADGDLLRPISLALLGGLC